AQGDGPNWIGQASGRGRRLLLITEPAYHCMPRSPIFFLLDPLRRAAVDHSHDSPPTVVFGYNDRQGICAGAKHIAYLGHGFDLIEYVYRKRVTEHHNEHMSCTDGVSCRDCGTFQFSVSSGMTYQARAGSLTKGDPEFDSGDGLHHRFVKILDGL